MFACLASCLGARFEPEQLQPDDDTSNGRMIESNKISFFSKQSFIVSLKPVTNDNLSRSQSMVTRSSADELEIQRISMDFLRYSIKPSTSTFPNSSHPIGSLSPFSDNQEILDPIMISPRTSAYPTRSITSLNPSQTQTRLSLNHPIIHDGLYPPVSRRPSAASRPSTASSCISNVTINTRKPSFLTTITDDADEALDKEFQDGIQPIANCASTFSFDPLTPIPSGSIDIPSQPDQTTQSISTGFRPGSLSLDNENLEDPTMILTDSLPKVRSPRSRQQERSPASFLSHALSVPATASNRSSRFSSTSRLPYLGVGQSLNTDSVVSFDPFGRPYSVASIMSTVFSEEDHPSSPPASVHTGSARTSRSFSVVSISARTHERASHDLSSSGIFPSHPQRKPSGTPFGPFLRHKKLSHMSFASSFAGQRLRTRHLSHFRSSSVAGRASRPQSADIYSHIMHSSPDKAKPAQTDEMDQGSLKTQTTTPIFRARSQSCWVVPRDSRLSRSASNKRTQKIMERGRPVQRESDLVMPKLKKFQTTEPVPITPALPPMPIISGALIQALGGSLAPVSTPESHIAA